MLTKRSAYTSVLEAKSDEVVVESYHDDILFSILEDLDENFIPSDSQTALQLLREQSSEKPCIILKTHLNYLINDRTSLERELIQQQYDGNIREFKLPGTTDTYFVFMDDILDALSQAKNTFLNELEKKPRNQPKDITVPQSNLEFGTLKGPPSIGYGLLAVPFTEKRSQVEKKKIEEKQKKAVIFG